ncbi:MAG: enoyl-CoA hydratase/isomerase family protein [Deltaproteobacteria bacterium]|nr:enoyl-CoA hydratase/isomerase family protein [Deltaproteobacteria bacterium]
MATDYSAYEFLKVEVADRVATVTLNRPDVRNAVAAAMHHEIEQIWLDLAEDHEVNVILLTGAGDTFSAGGDVLSRVRPTKPKGRGGRRIFMSDGRRVTKICWTSSNRSSPPSTGMLSVLLPTSPCCAISRSHQKRPSWPTRMWL